jgi:hypothetical protein
MITPEELRVIAITNKTKREREEDLERKEEERIAREARMERALTDMIEAKRQIGNIECDMRWASERGKSSFTICKVYTTDSLHLEGVPNILYTYFEKQGFSMEIEEVNGPDNRFEPDHQYFIKVSW